MLSLTDRYDVESIDPLCDGWQFGLGYDTRLQRQVLIAMVSNQVADQKWFSEWLQRRSAVSHSYVAELLDGERLKESFLCIFSRANHVQIGLPSLTDQQIYEAVEKIIQGAKLLYQEKIQFRFSAGQVLWDGEDPRLLGLPMGNVDKAYNLGGENPYAISQYTASLLEWNATIRTEGKQLLPLAYESGLNRLKAAMPSGNEGFEALVNLLRMMKSQPNDMVSSTESTVEDEFDMSDENDADFEPIEEDRAVTASPLRGWLILAVVIILVVAGLVWWFGSSRTISTSQHNRNNSSLPSQKIPISQNNHQQVMPNLINDSIPQAINKLERIGVRSENISLTTKNVSNSNGQIIATDPTTNQTMKKGQQVDLVIGVPSGSVLMPNLSGLNISTAAQQILALQLHYSYVYKNSPLANKGKIITQDPKPYTVVPKNSQVKFVVATSY